MFGTFSNHERRAENVRRNGWTAGWNHGSWSVFKVNLEKHRVSLNNPRVSLLWVWFRSVSSFFVFLSFRHFQFCRPFRSLGEILKTSKNDFSISSMSSIKTRLSQTPFCGSPCRRDKSSPRDSVSRLSLFGAHKKDDLWASLYKNLPVKDSRQGLGSVIFFLSSSKEEKINTFDKILTVLTTYGSAKKHFMNGWKTEIIFGEQI